MARLLPHREGQVRTMAISAGSDVTIGEVGHWYSPEAVAEMLATECEADRLQDQVAALTKVCEPHGGTKWIGGNVLQQIAIIDTEAECRDGTKIVTEVRRVR